MEFDIHKMLRAEIYEHPAKQIELIETHISWVILTGEFAYKIKKPVDFGFLDFSTLEKRHACCISELQLNRRLAPGIYLDVVSISGEPDNPVINGSGDVLEYAVKMRQFPQSAQLDIMLTAGELNAVHMDAIAAMVADFHQHVQVADAAKDYGSVKSVFQPVAENFDQIREHLDTLQYTDVLSQLQAWSEAEYIKLETVFAQRKKDGYIRECHGDMHLRNMLWLDTDDFQGPMAFDCIEFNANLRWIDVISEAAFLVMDLQDRQQQLLANRFLNAYLEITGDYAGLSILPFYLCYRAMVRAKVAVLRLGQKNLAEEERQHTLTEFESYLKLAVANSKAAKPKLIIMRGLSASGKSTVSQQLVDNMGVIRIRSDVERKRLFNVALTDSAATEIDSGIYSAQASQQTYEKLHELAGQVIDAGYSVIVDAAFLKLEQRKPFLLLAESLAVPYIVLEVTAPADVLRQRIKDRRGDVSDADLAVLEHQMLNWQPLDEAESGSAITVDTSKELAIESLVDRMTAV